MPFLLPPWYLTELSYVLVYAIACLGLNLLFGTTGLLSLGHAAYFGIGAYTGGFLHYFGAVTSLEAYLLCGVVGSTALAAVLGLVCTRTTGIRFTVLTLALAQTVYSVFVSGAAFRPFGARGRGLYFLYEGGLYLPRLSILGVEVPPERFATSLYYVIVLAFLGSAGLLWIVSRSPFGMALRAIRDNEARAVYVGIHPQRCRWYGFLISAAFAGLAGGLWGELDQQITPQQLHWLFSTRLVLATVLGGTRHFVGPVLGALAFVALQDIALRWAEHGDMVLGLLLIAVVFLFPQGIAGGAARVLDRARGPAVAGRIMGHHRTRV